MMKAAFPALLVFALAMGCLADDKPRTIVTRDHQTYEHALIVDRGEVSVTITYDAGVVHVPLENLPANIQKELGYISQNPEPPVETKHTPVPPAPQVARAQPPASATPPPIADALPAPAGAPHVEPVAPAAPAASPRTFTQGEANAAYGMKESSILKKWGKPLRTEKFTDLNKRKVEILVYDEDPSAGTKFWIYEKEGLVSGGICGGRPVRSAAQQAKLDAAQAAGN